jgi:hypothetical protein
MADTSILWQGTISATASGDSITNNNVDSNNRPGRLNYTTFRELLIATYLVTLTGGTSPTVQVLASTSDQDPTNEQWYNLNADAPSWTTQGSNNLHGIGPGTAHNLSLGMKGRITYNITGAPTACVFYVCIMGKN